MAEQTTTPAKVNPIKALEQQISAAKSVKDLLAINIVRDRYIKNYELSTGAPDGPQRYERDLFAFMEKVNNSPDLMKCDPFSIFACFVKVGTYGVSPDKIYLQPQGVKQKDGTFKQIMKVSTDPFAKKELLERMPTIDRVNDPQLVFTADEFSFSPLNKRVTKHEQKFPLPNPSEETVVACYVSVEFKDGKVRDFLLSLEELKKRRAKSKMNGGGELWTMHFGEACKKSVINYLYKTEYKAPETTQLFPQYEAAAEVQDVEHEDYIEPVYNEAAASEESKAEGTNPEEFKANVNEQTGEVYDEPKIVDTKKSKKKEEPFI